MNNTTAQVTVRSKRERVLQLLLTRERVNRFEIEQLARDHVPNSTIAELRADGLVIHSELIEVPGFGGRPARIAEYRLDPGSRELAAALISRSRRRA